MLCDAGKLARYFQLESEVAGQPGRLLLQPHTPRASANTQHQPQCFVMLSSSGELESEVAGQPGRLLRERYRKAAELSRVRGKLSALMINDLDAGIGRFGNTQVRFWAL